MSCVLNTASLVSNAKLYTDPFPYLVCDPALPWDLYEELERTRPSPEWVIAGRPYTENQRLDMPSRKALEDPTLPDVWRRLITYHTGKGFLGDLTRVFQGRFWGFDPRVTVGPRGTDADIQAECQIGLNTPLTKEQRVRGPHLDNPVELYGGLLYMNDDDTDFIIYRIIKKPEFHGKLEIKDECVEEVARVPCKRNVAAFFVNSPLSVHGVSPRKPNPNPRLLVNIIGEVSKPLFTVGHGRY